nr:putative serine/threonine-protein kinase isoform X1 [Ipomoea batatas]
MKFSCPILKCFGSASQSSEDREIRHGEGINGERFRIFSYEELRSATQGFRSSCKIGEGGFGIVYKGRLRDGSFVAVKVLSVELGSLRGEREFISEISALSDIKHENLVRLRGCCVNGDHRLLVYDYMENNSLIHCFLGEMVMEFKNCRGRAKQDEVQAWELHNAGRLTELVDPLLDGDFPAEEGGRLLKLGLLCVQETASLRPKMSAVMKMMISEDSMEGVEITRPGIVADLRDVKIGNKTSSQSFFSNRPSTSMSPSSPFHGGIRRTFS